MRRWSFSHPAADDSVLDLFCGLGNFTLPLARRAAARGGGGGRCGAGAQGRGPTRSRNGIGNARVLRGEPVRAGRVRVPGPSAAYDLLLLDPPRAGAVEIMERMPQWRPRRVVYISCHPGSLARDAGLLVHGQGFRLIGAGVMDMFPHTTHVESIAVFEQGA